MRILSITAGAAGMYCGSCFRDNALAAELLTRGHDAHLIPVYTPTRTDEPNVSDRKVLFGGISVYLQHASPWFGRLPRAFDRLWDAPGVISAFANRSMSTDPALLGGLAVAMLEGRDGVLRREFDKLVEWTKDEPPPDVINLPNSMLIGMAAPLREALGRPVCCTLQGEELFLDGLQQPYLDRTIELIRRHVPDVDRFIAVSDYEAGFMARRLQIPPDRISVVPLGITVKGYAAAEDRDDVFRVGYFARVAPEKGLHVLADAYLRFRSRLPADARVRCEAAGYMAGSARPYLDGVKAIFATAGRANEFEYRGSVDRREKIEFLRGLELLCVPATYDEPKGMFLLEAMACGVPVVQPRRGAFTEVVERTGGGVLVERDDPAALAEAFTALWSDRPRLEALGQRAFDGVRAHYAIERSADRLIEVYRDVIARTAAAAGVRR
jgi:glycosyltransferase involved in cell wall biosynthesis